MHITKRSFLTFAAKIMTFSPVSRCFGVYFFQYVPGKFPQKQNNSTKNTRGAVALSRASHSSILLSAYCSICLPRKPAAERISFCSTSPIFPLLSFSIRMTAPITSPSQMIGAIA